MTYNSSKTGAQVDAAVDKADTAVQPGDFTNTLGEVDAAVDDVQEAKAASATDTTAGRLLKVGDYGAGAAAGTTLLGTGNTPIQPNATDLEITDKIVHSGDLNTAIRFPAADTVTVETAGAERLRIDSSGNLLVGTTSNPSGAKTAVDGSVAIGSVFRTTSFGGPNLSSNTTYRIASLINAPFARYIELIITSFAGQAKLKLGGYSLSGQQEFTVVEGSLVNIDSIFITDATNSAAGEIRITTGPAAAFTPKVTINIYDGSTDLTPLNFAAV